MKAIRANTRRTWHSARVLLVFCSMLGAGISVAQRYPFFNLGIEQGLIQSQVFALAQDASGHLWSGTLGGLSCYDGHSFRSFTVRDGLPSNTITALRCDKNNSLWIGTNRGLSCYDGHRFRNYAFSGQDNPGGNSVSQISCGTDGIVWCIAGRSLYSIRAGKAAAAPLPQGYDRCTAIFADSAGTLWAGLPDAPVLYRLRKSHWDSLALPKPAFVHRLYQDSRHRLILLSTSGMYRYDAAGWTKLIARDDPKSALFYSFAESQDGSCWLSTGAGVIRLFNGSIQAYSKKAGLTDVLIYDLLTDREGNLWLASNGEGLYRFSGATFTAVDERMGLTGPQVSSFAQDAQGAVYLGSYDGGLYRYKDDLLKAIPFPGAGMHGPVTSLVMRGNTLWIGTQNSGLWQYDVAGARMRRYPDKRLGDGEIDMHSDSSGLWLLNGKSVALLTKDSLRIIPVKGSAAEAFTHIGRDSLLIATSEGLKLNQGDSMRPFITHSFIDSAQIVCMDYRGGTVWLGTVDNGVFGFSLAGGAIRHINRSNGLRSDFIYNIYAAPDGYIWAGTGYGICRIRPDGARPVVTFYGRSAGLIGMESNRNAVLPLADGTIWFGTTGGAVRYYPDHEAAITCPLSLQLQRIQLFGEAIPDANWYRGTSGLYGVPQHLRLPWRQNNLSFSFSAISLSGDETITYRYRLEGASAPWSEWSANGTVNYSALPPGHYELQVQCSTDGLHPQPQSLRYPFEIITPFHKTTLFRLLILTACIILGIAIQYAIARRKRARLAMIEALRREEQAKVRQRTAEDFHDEVGNKLTRINVLTNVLRSKLAATPDATRLIDQIQDNAGQLYGGTRDILWSLQPSNDSLYQVLHRIRDFGRDLFGDTEIAFDVQGIEPAWKDYRLPMDMSRNLIMIFKEALNNALKYAGADRVVIASLLQGGHLTLVLRDNGNGFDPCAVSRGQGITNIKTRATRLGGDLKIESAAGKGTTISLSLNIPPNKG